jgi:hypothetical protein
MREELYGSELNRLLPLCSIVVFFTACFLSAYQQPINAQTLEDELRKAKEGISNAIQSGMPLGTVSILSNSSYTDPRGVIHVVGEVYNDMAPNAARDVQAIATFYDSAGTVVGTNSSFTNPKDIKSGEKAPFDISLGSASITLDKIDHYDLKVDWK